MGFRFQRRISLGGGLGLNLSGSGISVSQRTRWGSFGTGGLSFRTGIPGLTYRVGSGRGSAFGLVVGLVLIFLPIILLVLQAGLMLLVFCIRVLFGLSLWILRLVWELLKWVALTGADFGAYCWDSWRARKWV
jgi:hypothetical protein